MVRLFGSRGRTPKYRLGLYGPHNKDELEAASDACTACSAKEKNMYIARTRPHEEARPLEEGDILSNTRIVGLVDHLGL